MNSWISHCTLGVSALLLTCSGAFAQAACGTSSNSCCTATTNGTPGCTDPTCCASVCAADPYCCNNNWDSICATAAQNTCATCQSCGDASNDCCAASPNDLPYCNDGICCNTVCNVDSYCCNTEWDSICANEASTMCIACGATPACGVSNNDCCVPSADSTPYCTDAECCTTVCAVDPYCCNTQWDGICANEAGDMCAACASCGNSVNDCCLPTANGSAFCADAECCDTVCAIDSYCCTNNWDGICAEEAKDLCAVCAACGNGQQDCCVASTTASPFCADAECCTVVCASDPYCCSNQWDGICANGAANLCAACAPPCPADFNGDNVVDGADLGSLLGVWGPCPGCPQDLNGDGLVDGADLGALLGAWGPC